MLRVSSRHLEYPHLKVLSLGGDHVDDAMLAAIARCTELEDLSLSHPRITDTGFRAIGRLRNLRRLSLSSEDLTDAGLEHLKALPRLEHIELCALRAGDGTLYTLSQIKSLTRIGLSGSNELPDRGPTFSSAALGELRALPALRALWITSLDPKGGFLGLGELKQLQSLVLAMTNVRADELERLEESLPATHVSGAGGGGFVLQPRPFRR